MASSLAKSGRSCPPPIPVPLSCMLRPLLADLVVVCSRRRPVFSFIIIISSRKGRMRKMKNCSIIITAALASSKRQFVRFSQGDVLLSSYNPVSTINSHPPDFLLQFILPRYNVLSIETVC